MRNVLLILLFAAILFGGYEQRSDIYLDDGRKLAGRYEVEMRVFDRAGREIKSDMSTPLIISDGIIENLDILVPETLEGADLIEIYHPEIGRHRIEITSSSLRRETPEEPGETSEELATHLQIGMPGETDDLVVNSPRTGFGVDTPTERVDIDGAIGIKEGAAPTATSTFGKVYVNDADGHLYYIDETGRITDLTVDANAIQSVSSSANPTGRTEHMRMIPGEGADITESATDDTIYIHYSLGGVAPCSSAPSAPSHIEGASTVCTGEPGAAFAVLPVAGATFYSWTVPADAVITAGMGSNSVNVVFGSTDGDVCASAMNGCGSSSSVCIAVTLNRPTSPGSITGTSPVCPGQTGVSYYITSVPGATNYIWTLPPGAVLASGTGTPNITVNFGTSGGDICVQTENSCGTSTPQCMPVVMTATPATPGVITGSSDVCGGDTDVGYSITPVAEATSYTWTVPSGASITAGSGTESITVDFGTTSGSVCVTASSICGTSSPSCKSVTVTNPPSAPGSITGSTVVVPSTADEPYSISPVTGATSYLWTVSGDASIDGSATSSSVDIDFGTTAGSTVDLCVTASNGCGTSSPTCLTITIAVPSGSQTFSYTGAQQSWTVPGGVSSVDIECWGAQGGTSTYTGGNGGYASGTLSVSPGDVLYVYVGQSPTSTTGGFNGGGNSGGSGKGGGGASDVRYGGASLSNRVIVGAGGGGGGYMGSSFTGSNGAYGGGLTGGTSTQSSGGWSSGEGGTQSAGGASTGCIAAGTSGTFGQGGNGINGGSSYPTGWGGGGGGGYYGGGGGGNCGGGVGGGGGSSYYGGVSSGTTTANTRSGHGQVIISW